MNLWAAILLPVLLVGPDDPMLPFDRTARIERIDFELQQIAHEKAKLEAERLALLQEKSCTGRAKTRAAMQLCAVPRP